MGSKFLLEDPFFDPKKGKYPNKAVAAYYSGFWYKKKTVIQEKMICLWVRNLLYEKLQLMHLFVFSLKDLFFGRNQSNSSGHLSLERKDVNFLGCFLNSCVFLACGYQI